jgi:phospholipid/cholesterol/gamma-HCH transport system permease protein
MASPATFTIEQSGRDWVAGLAGDWTAEGLGRTGARLGEAIRGAGRVSLDLSRLGACDTTGVLAVLRAAGAKLAPDAWAASPNLARLAQLVAGSAPSGPAPAAPQRNAVLAVFERLGRGAVDASIEGLNILGFGGRLFMSLVALAVHPGRYRWAAFFSIAERAGLDAIPIVTIATFFIGAVVAFIGADALKQFGAQIFVVDLIGISMMREFNIVITAVLIAGRSASSFAAEIGAMRMTQEIDAMDTMDVDPFQALVIPRFLALLVTMPLLMFLATLAGLAGGILVGWLALDISPMMFVQRLYDDVQPRHFLVALAKAPVMAGVIAIIGCRQGLSVGGDVESLGRRVTTAVVNAIFAIILIDALFAMICTKLGV